MAVTFAPALRLGIYIRFSDVSTFMSYYLTNIRCRDSPMWRYTCATLTLNTLSAYAPRGGGVRTEVSLRSIFSSLLRLPAELAEYLLFSTSRSSLLRLPAESVEVM